MTTKAQLIFCTCPNRTSAKQIANMLLDKRLAACINIISEVESRFFWQGKIESETEVMLKIKTKASLFESINQAIKAIHPYDVPEVIGIDIQQIDADYLAWLEQSVETAS
ncbi:divalent-cation tolerance protein CutA [Catenovulum sp. SM1970]|uniref:divalent-cation tolerance protein CutA n=1 Tax=Marinifaba aquimaris TaxID=2741323 RepID=UPI0015724B96|nr:divalent-cation tolerance protein CutA [Marinifaba aquimaris]NTS75316.1 divalent-cation tolerance protein CutA [Marinifaba aquimaris]